MNDESKPTIGVLTVKALRLRCVIGVSAEERRDRSDVTIDFSVGVDPYKGARTDDINDCWNYRTATKTIISLVENSRFYTIEKLAMEISQCLFSHLGTYWTDVSVSKPGALRFADAVGIRIKQSSEDSKLSRKDYHA